jgi:hypothetical protein
MEQPGFFTGRLVSVLPLLVVALGCSDEGGETYGRESDAVINGTDVTSTTSAVVAVYMRKQPNPTSDWYPHPCSGVVLTPSYNSTPYVLTARHCVVPEGQDSDDPPMPPEYFKMTGAYAPGAPTPPFDAPLGCTVYAPPVGIGYLGMSDTLDMAIIKACAPIPNMAGKVSRPLYMSSTGELSGELLDVYGYGCTSGFGSDCPGGGTLRETDGHEINAFFGTDIGGTGEDWPIFGYQTGGSGGALTSGDSGGPGFATVNGSRWMQVGVTQSNGGDYAISRISMEFIFSAIQRVYVRPHNAMTEALTFTNALPGASVQSVTTQSVSTRVRDRQWLRYNLSTHRFFLPDVNGNPITCLQRNGSSVVMQTCNTSNSQKWWVTKDSTIRDGNIDCLHRQSSGTVTLASCSASNTAQKWYFDPDSGVNAVF